MVARVMAWLTTESRRRPAHQHAAGGFDGKVHAINAAGNGSVLGEARPTVRATWLTLRSTARRVVLAGLVLLSLRRGALGPGGPVGVLRRQPGATARRRRFPGDPRGAECNTVRFLFAGTRSSRTGDEFNWSATDQVIGDLASQGVRARPVRVGLTSLGGNRRPVPRPPGQHRVGAAGLGGLPEGDGGSLRETEEAIGRTSTRQQFGQDAVPLPITAMADLERAQSPIERSGGKRSSKRRRSTPSCCRSPTTRSGPSDPQGQIVTGGILTQTDQDAVDFLDDLYSVPRDQGRLRRGRVHPYEGTSTGSTTLSRWLAR